MKQEKASLPPEQALVPQGFAARSSPPESSIDKITKLLKKKDRKRKEKNRKAREKRALEKKKKEAALRKRRKAQAERKKQRETFWTCNNRFNGMFPDGICCCVQSMHKEFSRSPSGWAVPIRCDENGDLIRD